MRNGKIYVWSCTSILHVRKSPWSLLYDLNAYPCYCLGNPVNLQPLFRSSLDAAIGWVWAPVGETPLYSLIWTNPITILWSWAGISCPAFPCFPYKPVLSKSWQALQLEKQPLCHHVVPGRGHTCDLLDCHPFDWLLWCPWITGNKGDLQQYLSSLSFPLYLPPHPFLLGKETFVFLHQSQTNLTCLQAIIFLIENENRFNEDKFRDSLFYSIEE